MGGSPVKVGGGMNNSKVYILIQIDAYGNQNPISAYSKKTQANSVCEQRNDNPKRSYDYKVKQIILR